MNQPTLSPYSCTAWRWILTKPHLRDACGQVQGNPPGSQAGIAVEGAVSDKEEEFPQVKYCLLRRRYVDDLAPGAQSKQERFDQEEDCKTFKR